MAQENKKKTLRSSSPRRSALSRFGSVVKWMFILGIIGVLFAGGAVAGYVASIVKDEPVRSEEMIQQQVSQNAITGFAYFRDGAPIGQLRQKKTEGSLNSTISPSLLSMQFSQ